MLEPKKSRLFEKIFGIYNRSLLKRRFHSLRVSGLENFEQKNQNSPLLIYANHSSWWDGLVMLEILRRFNFQNFVVMEEKNLRKLFFFRLLGAFSINRENHREARKSIDYAAKILNDNSNNTVLIFPQGEILPNDMRPINFYSGLVRIVEKTNAVSVIPVSLRFEFLGEFKPEIFVNIEKPDNFSNDAAINRKQLLNNFESKLAQSLDRLKDDISNKQFAGYERLF